MIVTASKLARAAVVLAVWFLLASPISLRAQTTAPASAPALPPPTRDEALQAIAALEADPLAFEKAGQFGQIVKFAEASDDVVVSVDSDLLPFFIEANRNRHSPLLIASFIGGNVRSQLNRKVAQDDSYAGLVMLLKTYDAIRAAEPDYDDPEIDKLKALEKDGKLKAYVEEMKAKRTTGASGTTPGK